MTAPPFFTTARNPKQAAFAEAVFSGQYRYLLAGGGIRGGKTSICLNIIFALCKIFPGSRWAIVRLDLPTLRRNTLPSFTKLKPAFVGPVNQSDWTATCENGSQILFFSESLSEDPDYNRWRGLEVNGFLLEEANELSGDIATFHMAIQRAGAWIVPGLVHQPPPLILLTCNPSPGWLKELFYDPWAAGDLAPPYHFTQMLVSDNHYLPQAYLDSLEDLKDQAPDQYNQMVRGMWEFPEGAVFQELRVGIHRVAPRPRTRGMRRLVSADWGTDNIAPALWSEIDDALDDAPRLHVYQEWGPKDMPPVRWAEGVLERSGWTPATGWADDAMALEAVILDSASWSNAPRPFEGPPIAIQMAPVFRRAGVQLKPSVKGPNSVRFGIDLLHTHFDTYRGELDPLLTISEACPELWKALTRIKRGKAEKGLGKVPAPDQHPFVDWLDALRYLVQSRPKPAVPDPSRLQERDPLQMAARDVATQHELRQAAALGVIDPIRDPSSRPEPAAKPWHRPRRRTR